MNITSLKNTIVGTAARISVKTQRNAPHILVGAGIVGLLGTVVLASKETLKVEDIIDETRSYKTLTDDVLEEGKFTKKEHARELLHLYTKTGISLARLYAPSIILGSLSIAAILKSHGIMQKRNVALVAAYTALDKFHKNYRKEVQEELGVEKERAIFERANVKPETTSEDGEQKDSPVETGAYYSKWFDESSPYFKKDSDYNRMFLLSQQTYFNDLLVSRGHVFLNEVYDALGFRHTSAGAVCGWLYEAGTGDDYIDFGIFNRDDEKTHSFINGFSNEVLLDFNVDGEIYNKI